MLCWVSLCFNVIMLSVVEPNILLKIRVRSIYNLQHHTQHQHELFEACL
jgi:hypothetical protein